MSTFELLAQAKSQNYALGAFNVAGLETFKAVANAASKLKSPVILEASDGEVEYIGYKQIVALKRIYAEEAGVPMILNLDHGKDLVTCRKAVEAGFDYIHFDGSKLPFEENVKIAKEVVKMAHDRNLPVEGEMDHIEGSSADHTHEDPAKFQQASSYTSPEKAGEFVERTGIDVLASFVGNLHGIYAHEMRLDMDLLKKISEAIPNTYLSLHGGSGINNEDVRAAIALGIVKVNVNSEMRIAYKMSLQQALNASNEVAIYKLTPAAIKAVADVVELKIKLFGSVDKV